MAFNYVKGNALDWAEKDGHCMIHVCNNKGGFGGGKTALATQVKERWPNAYDNYINSGYQLGTFSVNSKTSDEPLSVINLVAQDGYGARWKGIKYFDDESFEQFLKSIVIHAGFVKSFWMIDTIVVPYKAGADRAGGDWEWIISKVEEILGEHFNILVVEYEK